jgi:pyridoxine 4-dehydrogenase
MATTHTVKIGGSDSNVVGQIAHGLMMLTWTPQPVPYDQAFEAIKAGIDSLPAGVKMFLNSGEFYDNNRSTSNLDLVAAFFEKYPDYADKTFLSVKVTEFFTAFSYAVNDNIPTGGTKEDGSGIDSSPGNLRRSVDRINKCLRGFKRLDLFESARVDPKVPIEDTIRTLAQFVKEGKFDYIGLSEVRAETIRRANAVSSTLVFCSHFALTNTRCIPSL